MKFILSLSFLLALISFIQAMPRYILVPIHEASPVHQYGPVLLHRTERSAWPQGGANPVFALPPSIAAAQEQIAAGSEVGQQVAGVDAVDYGAYTGGYGAFGHYASYPNFDGIEGRRR